jgi:hypothetical protein
MQDELPLLLTPAMPGNLLTTGGLGGPAVGAAAGLVGMRLPPGELSKIDVLERLTRAMGVVLAASPVALELCSSCGMLELLVPALVLLFL